MENFQKILRATAYGLLLLDIVIVLAAVVGFSLLRLNGAQLLTVQSASMEPVLKVGDAVITSSSAGQSFHLGEIISYRNPADSRVIVSHRIVNIGRGSDQLITAGDALHTQDQPVPQSLVLGRVMYVLPGFGWFLNMLRKPWCLVVMLYLPAAILIFKELSRVARHFNRLRYQSLARR